MSTTLRSSQHQFTSATITGKLYLLVFAVLFCIVTAFNNSGKSTATVNITTTLNVNLSNLALSSGSLSPSFSSATNVYTASVSNATASITVTPTVSDTTAAVTVNAIAVASGSTSANIPLNVGDNTITTVVTATDGTTKNTYTVTVTRAQSSDATLANLVISSGTLTPSFAAGTTSYSASVSNVITSITITPTTNDTTAAVTVNGATVSSAGIALVVGDNIITTIITAQDGSTSTYTVTITRAQTLLPIFSYGGPQTYTTALAITPLVPASSQVAAPGYAISSFVGNAIGSLYGVAVDFAGNIFETATSTLTVKKILPDGTASSYGLGLTSPVGGIAKDAASNIYVACGSPGAGKIKKYPPSGGAGVVINVTGAALSSPKGIAVDSAGIIYLADLGNHNVKKIPAAGGAPVILAPGTFSSPGAVAVDGAGNVYVADEASGIVYQIPAGSATAVVFSSGYSAGLMGVAADPAGNIYVADAPSGTITKIPNDGGANVVLTGITGVISVAVDGAGNLYGTQAGGINRVILFRSAGGYYIDRPLPAGLIFNSTTGAITGTPTVASPATNYIITAYNSNGGSTATVNIATTINANLANLTLSGGALSPAFDRGTTAYTASVSNAIASITVTPTVSDATAAVTVNTIAVTSGSASASIPLSVGNNTITTVVTASDGTTKSTYTVTVTRATPPATITFNALTAKTYGVADFGAGATSDNSGVPITYSSDNTAVATIVSGSIHIVSAGTANITASQAADSTHAAAADVMQQLTVNQAALTITPDNQSISYGTAVPTLTVSYNGFVNGDASGSLSTPPSVSTTGTSASTVGQYPITASGAAGANYNISYVAGTLNITASSDAGLSNVVLSSGTLSPAFSTGVISYTASVSNTTASITITPTTSNAGATITINGAAAASGSASADIPLIVGNNKITVTIISQDGTVNTRYKVSVTRLATNANLANLNISSGTLAPTFATGTNSYAVSLGNGKTSVTLTPTTSDPTATVKVNGSTVTSGSASAAITLATGPNVIPVAVTAQDGATINTYTVTVNRAASTNAGLANLTISSGTLTPAFATATTNYTVISNSNFVTITPTSSDTAATIRVAGAAVVSGSPSAGQLLTAGANTITALVTAQNGTTQITYTLAVNLIILPAVSYSSPNTFTINTPITPLAPTGSGVAAAGYSNSPFTIGSGFSTPTGVAVDAAGNVYVADEGHKLIKEIPAGGGAPVTMSSFFSLPYGVASDAAGNVYVADYNGTSITEIPAGGGFFTSVLGTGFLNPTGVAVDAAGNVYVADYGNGAVKKIPVNSNIPVAIGSGFSHPAGVAVDGPGNVYVADAGNSTVKKIPAGGGAPVTLGSGFISPHGVAVDGLGNVYVSDYGNNAVKMIPIGGGAPVTLVSGLNHPVGISIGTSGILYLADLSNNVIKEIKPTGGYFISPSLPPGLSINGSTGVISGTPTVVSPATNYTVTAFNGGGSSTAVMSIGVAAQNANLSSLTFSNGTLSPALSNTITGYSVFLPPAIPGLTVTPVASDPGATVTVNGTVVPAGNSSGFIFVPPGSFYQVTIIVTGVNNSTKTYTVGVFSQMMIMPPFLPFNAKQSVAVANPADNLLFADGIVVHQGLSPNGDGINDVFTIDGIDTYPENKVTIMNRNGEVVYQAHGYDNSTKVFDGHSSINGVMQLSGTYFYSLEYKVGEDTKRKSGFIILKW